MLGNLELEMPSDLRSESFELDSSFVKRSKGITRLTVDIGSSSSRSPSKRPSLWRTPEFIFYAVAFCVVVPIMIWIPITLSSNTHPNYPLYRRKLTPGWIFGREVDNSDSQYRAFRGNVPILTLLVGVLLGTKSLYTHLAKRYLPIQREGNLYLTPFLLLFSILLLLGLHGTSTLKIFIILSLNYSIAKFCKASKFSPVLTWVFNMAVLFANEKYSGYRFASIHPSLEAMDSIEGIYPRWHISFNITMLRLVSFNMDYYWACIRVGTLDTGHTLTDKQRTTTAHPLDMYTFQHYLTYVLYAPLYIAGPIMTFNDFLWQLRRPIRMPIRGTLEYLCRFVTCILTLEFILHFMYMVAIKDTKAWYGDTAVELSMIGFWNLIIVWLKLLVPWRFFRLWALADGIDPPENMVRCMANNYSTLGFWRSWHRSYNLWIVRYIYIPLGGTRNVVYTTVLVFSFVALWHDLSFKLLAWGWLVSLFILPELAARYFLPPSKYGDEPWYRHVCAIGAVFNILMMMAANLVGFVIGTEGIQYMLNQLFSTWEGIRFIVAACVCWVHTCLIVFLSYREEEMRRGIYRRC